MNIAVAVLLAIASARKGIHPQSTIDLRYGEIGPDTGKEPIVGAVVFKKEKKEKAEGDDLKVTFTPKSIDKVLRAEGPEWYLGIGKISMNNADFEQVHLKAYPEKTYISGEMWLDGSGDEPTKEFARSIYTEIEQTYDANKTTGGGIYGKRKLFNQQGKPEATFVWTMPNAGKIQEATDEVIKELKWMKQ